MKILNVTNALIFILALSPLAGPAKIIVPPQTQTIIEYDEALFYCQIDGNPVVSLKLLYNGLSHSNIISIPNGAMIRIAKVQKENNEDKIDCIVKTPTGEETRTAYLRVIGSNNIPLGFPRIKHQKDYYEGDVGQQLKMLCEAEGTPSPSIKWFKDNAPIDILEPRRAISKSGSLIFTRLMNEDKGIYECNVINSVGSTLSYKIQLKIRNTPITPQWISRPSDVEVRPGHGANLTCSAKGNPTPQLRWLTQYHRPINDLSEKESILLLTDITEPASYICRANNSMGVIQHHVKVRVKKIPKPPVRVRTVEISSTFAIMSWNRNPAPDSHADSYTLIITDKSSDLGILGRKQIADILPWPLNNATIEKNVTDLKPFTSYSVNVYAISNSLGMSDSSPTVVFQTQEQPPSSPPQSVYANADTSKSIIVNWATPVEANGEITGYNVYYTNLVDVPLNLWLKSVTERNFVKILDLIPNNTYHIRVNAVNKAGNGPVSQVFPIIIRPGVPPQPQNFRGAGITSTSINLIWSSPKIPRSLKILEYILTFRVESSKQSSNLSNKKDIIKLSPDLTEYTLVDLWPNTHYYIKLAARTVHGIGVEAKLNISTENRVPSTPLGTAIKVMSPTSIQIQWKKGLDNQESTKSFKIKVTKLGINSGREQQSELPFKVESVQALINNYSHVYEHLIEKLEKDQLYQIMLWSIGDSGLSAPYVFADVKTQLENPVPSPPQRIRLNQLRQKQEKGKTVLLADIAWDAPENGHGQILQYAVKHRLVGPLNLIESLAQRSIPIKQYFRNVTSAYYSSRNEDPLGFGKIYEFSVAAVNSMDIGLETKMNVTTRESAPDMYPVSIEFTGLTSQSVNISWLPPPPEHHNGLLIGYQVLYFMYGLKNTTSRSVNTANQFLRIEDLKENVLYTFQVRASTNPGPGPWCPEVSFRTATILPDPPKNIVAERINERQIKVTWELPQNDNIRVTGFKIYHCSKLEAKDQNNCNTLDVGPVTMTTLGVIESGSDYLVGIKSRAIDNRFGDISKMVVVRGENIVSHPILSVKDLKCEAKDTSIKINWSKPEVEKELSRFLIRISGSTSYMMENGKLHKENRSFKVREVEYGKQFTKFVIDLKDMEPNTIYDISVHTMYKKGENSLHYGTIQNTTCRTLMTKPQSVKSPEIISMNSTSLSVLFRIYRVTEKLGIIKRYYLIVEEASYVQNSSLNKYTLDSLKTEQQSQNSPVLVAEFSTEIFKGSSNISLWVGNDLWLPNSAKTMYMTDYIIRKPINFKMAKRYTVCLRACVYEEYFKSSNQENLILCTDSPWGSEFDFSNIFIPEPSSKPDTMPKRKTDVFTVAIIAVIAGLGIVALISIAVGCFMKRRRPKRYYNSPQELIMNGDPSLKQALISQPSSAPPAYVPLSHSNGIVTDMDSSLKSNHRHNNSISRPPIPSSHLAEYIQSLKTNENSKFTEEYESIDPGQQFTWIHSNIEVNKPKNRYANVIAYDHSRVALSTLSDKLGSDYINGNYCDGYRKQNAYIATQGPLPETFEAFWRMVWENRCAVIVMMTKLEERLRVKCDQYWPTRGSEFHSESGLTITQFETVELAYYTMRKFSISKKSSSDINSNKETRDIFHFQFTAWPDHGVPDTPLPLLMFIRRVRSCSPADAGPIVVHCSAGVGRTGAYIVLDSQLSQLQHEKAVDIYGLVCRLRAQRNYMVQTEEQYVFIYEALLEASLCGNTEVSIRHLHAHVTKLKQPLPVLGVSPNNQYSSGMEMEFKHLSELSCIPKQFNTANLPENRLKNRLINILPYENSRVCLTPLRNQDGSDYVNASFVDGYRSLKSYIATQGPLSNTIVEFWRMLWQHNSCIVVMLSQLREMGREKCCQYWPTERPATFGQIVVEPMVEYNMPSFILREFRVRHNESDTHHRTIRQFQFLDWPEQGVPRSGESLIDFIGQVHKTKEQFGQEGPISVHCSAGVGRTGVFLALSIILDRMRSEATVDLFQTVRLLRMQRSCMVQTEDQYQFCYLTALEYLSSFDQFLS